MRLSRFEVPEQPGVYAWYRNGSRVYVGKAGCLKARIGGDHLGKGLCVTGSALRRNVAEHLGIAKAADLKARRRTLDPREAKAIRQWIEDCEVTWIICSSETSACDLEGKLKQEFRPPLTKI